MQVWRVELAPLNADLAALWASLSPDEHARANRFHFDRDRHRFVAARGALRRLLAGYCDTRPDRVRFAYMPEGKPVLAGPRSALRFNLAHSEDLALIAVAEGREVGVDLEPVPSDRVVAELQQLVFSEREREWLRRQEPAGRCVAFARLWTRKEALIKADGRGLGMPLDRMDVSGRGVRPLMLEESTGTWTPSPRWRLRTLRPGRRFAGAVAAEGDGWRVTSPPQAGHPILSAHHRLRRNS